MRLISSKATGVSSPGLLVHRSNTNRMEGRKDNPYDQSLTAELELWGNEKKLEYSTLNAARSAISAITPAQNHVTIGSHPIVSRSMKGIYRDRPPKPRYQTPWGPQKELNYLSSLGTPVALADKTLKPSLS